MKPEAEAAVRNFKSEVQDLIDNIRSGAADPLITSDEVLATADKHAKKAGLTREEFKAALMEQIRSEWH